MCARPGPRPVPSYASSLIGRDSELDQLRTLLDDPEVHLVTLTGTAGVGKTRLAATLASESTSPDILFVSLATVRDEDLVLPEIGRGLDLSGDEMDDNIYTRLAGWNGILILDNFEQVIDAASQLAEILPNNPNLTTVVTSQRPLQIDGERVVRLTPLAVPGADTELDEIRAVPSVQLMIDRALQQDDSMGESLEETETIQAMADICRKLDGLPLAIELAASRLVSLSPEMVLNQLEKGQRILSTIRRDTPERQRTMHSAIGWSYELLPDEMQQIFLWLGAFPGGFDLNTVERVSRELDIATPSFDIISELMSLSLVRRVSGGSDPWYSMLMSIREFCLAELDATGQRPNAENHAADHVINLVKAIKADLSTTGFSGLTAHLERELPTIRSAVRWALDHDNPVPPLTVAAGIYHVFQQYGSWRELTGWIDSALGLASSAPQDVVIDGLLAKLAMLEEARERAAASETDTLIQEMLKAYPDPILEMRYLTIAGSLAMNENDWPVAEQRFSRVLHLAGLEGNERAKGSALANLGGIAFYCGDYTRAEDHFKRAKSVFDDSGNLSFQDRILTSLAATANARGRYQESVEYLHEAIEIEDQLGLDLSRVYSLLTLGTALIGTHNYDAAQAATEEAIVRSNELGHPFLEMTGLTKLALIAHLRGNVSTLYENLLRSLNLQTELDDPLAWVDLGILTATALMAEARYKESAAMMGKTSMIIDELNHSLSIQEEELANTLMAGLESHLPDLDDHLHIGRSWSQETFVRSMKTAARRFNGKWAGIVVTIPTEPQAALAILTPRENEIVQLLVNGNSTQEMADQLSLSPRTVTTHLGNIMGKLEVSSRAELVAKVLKGRN